MRAGLRLGLGWLAAGLMLGSVPALAQDSGQATTNTPATDAIGPAELQNFSITGTVTRPADQPPAARPPAPLPSARAPSTAGRSAAAAAPTQRPTDSGDQGRPAAAPVERQQAVQTQERLRQTPPASSVTVALPRLQDDSPRSSAAVAVPASAAAFAPEPPSGNLAPDQKFPVLPWLLAALALGVGGAFLFWRNRSREAFAGGAQVDAFSAPEPAPSPPVPKLAPAPPKRPPSSIPGLVSTRLRPWLDFDFHPLRCIVEDSQVTIEFELELFNAGSAPARAVLVEATLFNAGPDQDREINAFFANPVGAGERIVSIQPLKRMTLRNKVVLGREQVQIFDIAGRKVFVPLIAFNALYRWSGGEGQSSISYVLGRDTKGEKMAPFRLDLGPRVFRGVGARPLPMAVRS